MREIEQWLIIKLGALAAFVIGIVTQKTVYKSSQKLRDRKFVTQN